jgi:hypothetical protein
LRGSGGISGRQYRPLCGLVTDQQGVTIFRQRLDDVLPGGVDPIAEDKVERDLCTDFATRFASASRLDSGVCMESSRLVVGAMVQSLSRPAGPPSLCTNANATFATPKVYGFLNRGAEFQPATRGAMPACPFERVLFLVGETRKRHDKLLRNAQQQEESIPFRAGLRRGRPR